MRDVEMALEDFAYAIAQELSSDEWLFFLRQAPYLFKGYEPAMTWGYLASHAETISALSAKPASHSESLLPGYVAFGMDASLFSSMHRLGAVSYLLGLTQNLVRCAGKGSVITHREGVLPGLVPNPAIDEMTALWDKRMGEPSFDFLSRAGLYSHRLHGRPTIDDDVVPIIDQRNDEYVLRALPLASIPTFADPRLPVELRFPTPVLDLIVFLISANLFRIGKAEETKSGIEDFGRTGMNLRYGPQLLSDIEIAVELIRQKAVGKSIPSTVTFDTPVKIFNRLAGQDVTLWPPSFGPVIRRGADDLYLRDLWAASQRLARELARPKAVADGELANVWSNHFEHVVQETINATAWKPSPNLAKLRGPTDRPGPTLKAGGEDITNLDAVGEHDGLALLVSCKCWPFTENWQRGDYGTVRNLATNVDNEVAGWDAKVARLRAQPVGNNYDLSAYSELIGVVVLPEVPWTADRNSVREVATGLRVAVSANELDRWMHGE
jgi:hypothetical protein